MSDRDHESLGFGQVANAGVIGGQATPIYRIRHTSGEILVRDLQAAFRMLTELPGARLFVVTG